MSNEEAKTLLIKTHWEEAGFDWTWIETVVTERGDIAVHDPIEFQASKEYKHAYEEGLIRATGPWQNRYHYELYSLVGIDKNNGWTRIEPDRSNLPNKSGPVDIIENGKEHRAYFNVGTGEFTSRSCPYYIPTHYIVIEPRPKPLF